MTVVTAHTTQDGQLDGCGEEGNRMDRDAYKERRRKVVDALKEEEIVRWW